MFYNYRLSAGVSAASCHGHPSAMSVITGEELFAGVVDWMLQTMLSRSNCCKNHNHMMLFSAAWYPHPMGETR